MIYLLILISLLLMLILRLFVVLISITESVLKESKTISQKITGFAMLCQKEEPKEYPKEYYDIPELNKEDAKHYNEQECYEKACNAIEEAKEKDEKFEQACGKPCEIVEIKPKVKKRRHRNPVVLTKEEIQNKRDRYDELLDTKERELISDDQVFYRCKVNKKIFFKYASEEQVVRLKQLQEKCKQNHRAKFSLTKTRK